MSFIEMDFASGGSVPELDLLWTNPSPSTKITTALTVNFEHQLPDDATGFIVYYKASHTSTAQNKSIICPLTTEASALATMGNNDTSNNSYGRNITTATKNSMTFAKGYNNGTQNDSVCIPTFIYAVRGMEIPIKTNIV